MVENVFDFLPDQKDPKVSKSQIRNLVFAGSGVVGVSYIGALQVLEKEGILERIERLAGTSSGSIASTLVSFREPMQDTVKMIESLELAKVPQSDSDDQGRGFGKLPLPNSENYHRIFDRYGWYSTGYFYEWIKKTIAEHCEGKEDATFRDFKDHKFRDLHIIGANISRRRAEDFSYETTPDVSVADAVRISMSIPLYFEALRFDGKSFGQGDYYVDGGLYDSYPIHIFDHKRFAHHRRNFRDGINWETLGFSPIPGQYEHGIKPVYPDSIWQFLSLMIQSFFDSFELPYLRENMPDQIRTVMINDLGVSGVDFDLKSEDETYQHLIESGKNAVEEFLKKMRR